MKDNKQQDYVIGIDLGTSSCKTIIINISGDLLGFGSASYAADNLDSQWKEQNSSALFDGLITSLQSAIQSSFVSPIKCLGISIGGALHSIMAVDHEYKPLSGVLTWADTRAINQSEFIAKSFDTHNNYLRSGCPNNQMYPLAKILWMKEKNKNLFRKTDKFISAKEYILWRLTGERIIDYAIASGSGLFNISEFHWDQKLLEIAGIKENKLAPVSNPLHEVGPLDVAISKLVGLQSPIPVFLGSADAVNSSLGAGTIDSHSITCMVGSSGAIRTISNRPIFDTTERLWCYCIDQSHWLVGGAINNGGLALDWLRRTFNLENKQDPEISFQHLINWASEVPILPDGLICLPFFIGERSPYWNTKMRAILWGLTIKHDHRNISQAVLEGIGFRLKSVLDSLVEVIGEIQDVRASGGFIKSAHWVQILSNIFNKKILIPKTGETSALGAAYWVILALGISNSFDSIRQLNNIEKIYKPQKKYISSYQSAFSIYKRIYFQNREIFNSLD